MNDKEYFCKFMKEYIEFLDEMIKTQKIQLEAVLSRQVKQVEKSVATFQTYLMKFDSMEKRRIELQHKAGFGDKTFRQIIDSVKDSEKQELQTLFETMEKKISDISYYNSKCQKKVKLDLKVWGSDKENVNNISSVAGYTANKKQIDSNLKSPLFETKA